MTASKLAARSAGRTARTLAREAGLPPRIKPHLRKNSQIRQNLPLAFAVGPCTVPGQAEPPEGSRGTGEPICWGEPRPERRGAQALSAPARQLTPQADERGLCRCHCGALPQSSSCCCASSSRAGRMRSRPPRAAPPIEEEPPPPAMLQPGLWSGQEVPGTKAKLLPDGTAAAPADAPDQVKQAIWAANSLQDLPYRLRRRAQPRSSTSPTAPTAPAPSRSPSTAATCWTRRSTPARS